MANGTQVNQKTNLIHPHYLLMSALLRTTPEEPYRVLRAMRAHGLLPPWGMVENVTCDLGEYLPMLGSLNASFEVIAAYHLWAKATGQPDEIYLAAERCAMTADAIKAFYPSAGQAAAGGDAEDVDGLLKQAAYAAYSGSEASVRDALIRIGSPAVGRKRGQNYFVTEVTPIPTPHTKKALRRSRRRAYF